MIDANIRRKPMVLVETMFDIVYLVTVLLSGMLLCIRAEAGHEQWLFGIMALILGAGDSFHLIPRIYALWGGGTEKHIPILGIGKLIASITMTIFYVILWHIGLIHYPEIFSSHMTGIIYALAVLRIVLCVFPQNHWTSANPPLKWSIWRNIPFLAMGMFVMVFFAKGSFAFDSGLSYLWVAVFVSFVCYLPVVLFSGRSRKVGMLMLPKSCAYAAIVLMGFTLGGL
ncbi:hypothetical protein [Anaerocolumna xylanovorans]|uniref:Uncharacterized protein n=1 Tax=Anaerocolumna xylanovorans DSM 12503 TaxID=1121345 RepID=A0A1M7Y080_9FIRM|nr:hypothetical protein [Anaerocolumna xylanovorans]SHO44710.1 hypothetical protein SAMN02745217_00696 [Anaerocolumna xylanovorans DSM 12503]